MAPRRGDPRPGRPRPQPQARQAGARRCACAATRPPTSACGSAQVAQSLRTLVAGDETSLWRAPDGENYDVNVRLPPDDRNGVADLQRIWFTAGTDANGSPRIVQLAQVADVVNDVGASQINRRDLKREVQINANVSGRSAGEVSGDIQKILAETKLPPGYRYVFGGSTKNMDESFGLCRPGAGAGGDLHLHDPGQPVRQLPAAARHHDLAAAVADRRGPGPADRRLDAQHLLAPSASSC